MIRKRSNLWGSFDVRTGSATTGSTRVDRGPGTDSWEPSEWATSVGEALRAEALGAARLSWQRPRRPALLGSHRLGRIDPDRPARGNPGGECRGERQRERGGREGAGGSRGVTS